MPARRAISGQPLSVDWRAKKKTPIPRQILFFLPVPHPYIEVRQQLPTNFRFPEMMDVRNPASR